MLLQLRRACTSWAGIQQGGTWLELIPVDDPDRPLCWLPPGDYEIRAGSGRVIDRYSLSPEGEPERLDNETRHEVMLTRGLWMGDTACTQAL